ncbi:MAG: hypothetical protein EXR87_06925 [Gammaproteobacteria bacterium]|nr:hypothetical protein [Gammaproteobacteria bacterium]
MASPQNIRGLRKANVIVRMLARVVWLVFQTSRSPLRTVIALRRLLAALQTEQWATPTLRRARLWTSQKCVFSSGRYFWDFYAPGWP